MKSAFPPYVTIPLIIFCAVGLLALYYQVRKSGDERVGNAYEHYSSGESAHTIAERKKEFNQALELYLALEAEYHPLAGNGKLYYNIGNTYFQLEEYPLARLYFERAKLLLPRDGQVAYNLSATQEKLKIPPTPTRAFSKLFFFHSYLSKPERLQLFFIFSLILLGLVSLNYWKPNPWLNRGAILFTILAAIMMLSLLYTRYISPADAILIQSSDIRRDAGTQYAKVTSQPLPSGSKIEILDVMPNNTWLKVLTPAGDMGYVMQDTVRIIDASP